MYKILHISHILYSSCAHNSKTELSHTFKEVVVFFLIYYQLILESIGSAFGFPLYNCIVEQTYQQGYQQIDTLEHCIFSTAYVLNNFNIISA